MSFGAWRDVASSIAVLPFRADDEAGSAHAAAASGRFDPHSTGEAHGDRICCSNQGITEANAQRAKGERRAAPGAQDGIPNRKIGITTQVDRAPDLVGKPDLANLPKSFIKF